MSSNIIKEYGDIHDYEIISYNVDVYNNKLQIFTEYSEEEKKSITFTGVLAHHFEHVIYRNILFDVTQVTIDCFINTKEKLLEESLRYGFPTWSENIEELRTLLKKEQQKTFKIYSSLGLNGFVIAKEIFIEDSN